MKNRIRGLTALFFIIFVVAAGAFSNAGAYTLPETLRIGLASKYKEVAEIPIVTKDITVGYGTDKVFKPSGSFTAKEAFSVVPANLYYVATGKGFTSQNEATAYKNECVTRGFKAVLCLTAADNWTVYLGGYSDNAEVSNAISAFGSGTAVAPNGRRTALLDGGANICLFDSMTGFPQIKAQNGNLALSADRRYRGCVEFGRYAGVNLTAVNVISMDEYLYSAVGSEMPSGWHPEALKAQTLAARTYAVTRSGVHSDAGYELCDTTHCQVYLGAGNEAESVIKAVNDTHGMIILYNGKPIDAVFFSSSGGYTDNSENVWTETVPYLRAVADWAEQDAKLWSRTFTLDELTGIMSKNGDEMGGVTGVYIKRDAVTGRVNELSLVAKNGVKSITRESIRTYFSVSDGGALESRNFMLSNGTAKHVTASSEGKSAVSVYDTSKAAVISVDPKGLYMVNAAGETTLVTEAFAINAAGNVTNALSNVPGGIKAAIEGGVSELYSSAVTFIGMGWGHGAGMSQYGAKALAESGYTFDAILKYYYTGVTLGN